MATDSKDEWWDDTHAHLLSSSDEDQFSSQDEQAPVGKKRKHRAGKTAYRVAHGRTSYYHKTARPYHRSGNGFRGKDFRSAAIKSTVQKIVKEILESVGQNHQAGKDFHDALAECAVEFVTLISSEANEISEREQKKTIGTEHIVQALKDLDFDSYIGPVQDAADEHKKSLAGREKKQTKAQQSGLTDEELLAQQQELFRSATDKFHANPQDSTEPAAS